MKKQNREELKINYWSRNPLKKEAIENLGRQYGKYEIKDNEFTIICKSQENFQNLMLELGKIIKALRN